MTLKKIIEAQSVNERIESRIKAAETLHKKWANIEAIRTRPEGSSYLLNERFYGGNIVTNAGDTYYAQLGAGDAVTNDFAGANGRHEMRTTAITPAKTDVYNTTTFGIGRKTVFTGYPAQNDSDPDNTATNKQRKVTWRYDYTTGDFSQVGLTGGCIHAGGSAPSGALALLTSYSFAASFDKTSSDTLKVIINHDFLGA